MPFTKAQSHSYFSLAREAWQAFAIRNDLTIADRDAESAWRHAVNESSTEKASTKDMTRIEDFDAVMLDLAIEAGNMFWITRLSHAAENRMLFMLDRFLKDLEFVQQKPADWAYVCAIFKHMKIPAEIGDCPAKTMAKVLHALDTQIRRICKREGIELKDLPSHHIRRGMPAKKAEPLFHHEAHHGQHHRRAHHTVV